jgi:hypothetical protein
MPLSSAVADLERRGLAVLYSSDLVRPWMKVAAEPTAIGRVAKPVVEGLMRRVFLASGPRLEAWLRRGR